MVVGIIFARLSSTRLPGKLLRFIGDIPLICQVYARAKLLEVDKIIVATSQDNTDDELVQLLIDKKIEFFRGDLNDVALRTCQCIQKYNIDTFVRINGDSPLLPYNELNLALKKFKNSKLHFITNLLPRTYPYGYSVEIFNANFFYDQYKYFNNIEKEHITQFFYSNSDKFDYYNYSLKNSDYSNSISLTIDDLDSFCFMNSFYTKFPDLVVASFEEIIQAYLKIKIHD